MKTDQTGQMVRTPAPAALAQKSERTLEQLLVAMQPAIVRSVPKHVSPDRIARITLSALRTTPDLMACTPLSFLASVMSLAALGLEPNTPLGHAWLIPRPLSERRRGQGGSNASHECTTIIGYKGFVELAGRAGHLLYARAVREGDTFEFEDGLHQRLVHRPSGDKKRMQAPLVGAWAKAMLANGRDLVYYMAAEEIEARRAFNPSSGKPWSPWVRWPEPMYAKSACRGLVAWVGMAAELTRAVALDETSDTPLRIEQQVEPELREEAEQILRSAGVEPDDGDEKAGS